MAPVGGRPLIEHTLDRFRAAGICRVTVIINEGSDDCRRWLGGHGQDFDLDVIVRTTPSSYASFQLVAARLADCPALITTVDSILPVDDFRLFVSAAAAFPSDAVVLGLTGHVDDDNPLWATLDVSDGRILRLGGDGGSHVTAGLYWLPAHGSQSLRPASPGSATISNGWSTGAIRFTASSCRWCSTSIAHATSRRPNWRDSVSTRTPANERRHDLLGRLPRGGALARTDR